MSRTEKIALITGAGKRIGRGIALDLADNGWKIGVHYHNSSQAADEVCSIIKDKGGEAVALQADLYDMTQVRSLVPACQATLGAPCCLINNASLFNPDSLQSVDDDSWDSHLDVNLKAPIFLSQAFVKALPEGQKGNIINLLDQKVWRLTPYFMSYTLSKAALWTATQTLAQALAPQVRVNAIGPGPTLPNIRQTQEEFEAQCLKTPLQVGTSPEEIATAIRFILDSPAMTGQMIALDGGRHLAWQTPDVTNTHD